MKKFLYGTTALAAVSLAAGPAFAQADPLHMELGGYYQQFFGFTDQKDIATENGPFNYQNAEVYFKMVGELDNGLPGLPRPMYPAPVSAASVSRR